MDAAAPGHPPHFDAVVLAGGAARRMDGLDKPALRVGGRTLLDRVLGACREAATTVVVGPRRPTARPVLWTRERPPGGGPLAALAAGLRETSADLVAVLAADLPFAGPETVAALLAALPPGADGVLCTDPGGRDQPLLALYRGEPLRRETALLAAEHGSLGGLPLRLLTGELRLARLPDPAGAATFDTDTPGELAGARARIREHGRVLNEWISAVRDELGIDLDVDTSVLLDLARDAAHGVARPAAPLTTFLVGYAAALAGGGPERVAEAAARATALAARWQEEDGSGAPGAGSA
jgi:molybdopterin-guanine dinucleotide biosynthesis protein A